MLGWIWLGFFAIGLVRLGYMGYIRLCWIFRLVTFGLGFVTLD